MKLSINFVGLLTQDVVKCVKLYICSLTKAKWLKVEEDKGQMAKLLD